MNEILPYLLKSAVCLFLLYLPFRVWMRKEASFNRNRLVLLTIVVCSIAIPAMMLPGFVRKPVEIQEIPFWIQNQNNFSDQESSVAIKNAFTPEKAPQQVKITIIQVFSWIYGAGVLISLLILVHDILQIFKLFTNAEKKKMNGSRLLIVKKDIPAFSFGHLIFISRNDYENHSSVILTHELEHIRLNHFYDLIFLETVKILFWFNPIIWLLIRDIKDIHEFQADHHLLNKGIDARQYQLLIIQKGVGSERFALANSFNQLQIKKRIIMMNIQKTSKSWIWKATIFVPVIVLLILVFARQESVSNTADPSILANIVLDEKPKVLRGNNVYGKVIFSDGKPLEHVFIKVGATIMTTYTDKDGKFELYDLPKDARLYFFDDGFKYQSIKADFKNSMIIKLDSGPFYMGKIKVVGHVENPPKQLSKGYQLPPNSGKTPLLILDGVPSDPKKVNELESHYINYLSEKAGVQKYGLSGKNGVVELTSVKNLILPTKNSKINLETTDHKNNTKPLNPPGNYIIDKKPEFIGGEKELMKFIAENINYPNQALLDIKQENIQINFTVNKNGKIEQVKVKNARLSGSENSALEAEASRIFNSMPKWSPGKKNGVPVDVPCDFGIEFILR